MQYYAAFLEGIEFLRRMGVGVEPTAAAHQHVVYIINHSQDDDLAAAGGILGDLREHRNGADYRLQEPAHSTENHATLRVREAGDVMVALSACRGNRSRFVPAAAKIREYAENVLPIQVAEMPE